MEKIIIYNPRHGGEINDVFARVPYKVEINSVKKYDKVIADYLLKKYDFLREIEPKDLPEILKTISSKFVCSYKGCDYVAETEQKLKMHILGKHKFTNEVKSAMDSIEDATPVGEYVEAKKTPEEMEGIPDTSKGDKENWYGDGLTADSEPKMMVNKKPGTPGNF